MSRVKRFLVAVLPPLFILILLGLGWQWYVTSADVNAVILPPPGDIFTVLWDRRDLLMEDLAVTAREIFLGFVVGVVAGMLFGVLIARSKIFERTFYPIVIASQAVPIFAIAPLLVIWFGFGVTPKVIMAAVIVFFPICVNQVIGLRSADESAIEVMRSYGASEFRIFRSVRFPYSVPFLLAGMQLGATYAVVGAVVAEWLGASEGLGYRMVSANANSQTDLVFAAILVTAVVGIALFVAVRVIGNLLFPWQSGAGRARSK